MMYPSWAVGPVLDRPPPPCTVSGSSHHSTLTLWVSAQISTDFLLCRLKEGGGGVVGDHNMDFIVYTSHSPSCAVTRHQLS